MRILTTFDNILHFPLKKVDLRLQLMREYWKTRDYIKHDSLPRLTSFSDCIHLDVLSSLRLVRTSFELRAIRASWLLTDISSIRNSSRYSLMRSMSCVVDDEIEDVLALGTAPVDVATITISNRAVVMTTHPLQASGDVIDVHSGWALCWCAS